ncbi:MAG TPA: DNA polymerase III subunit beta [Vicinamibacteria bacterium]|nr:DNA polymerase III subunit beta [Vicinamibacteria bacterium]
MEIVVRKNDLLKELQLVQGIVERKNSIPILSNVLVEAAGGEIRISATDLDVSLRCGCPAQVAAKGALTLQAKKLYEIVRVLPESDVHLKQLPDAWASLECEHTSFKIAGLPKEDFPALPESKPGKGVEIPAEALRDLIARTAFAITAEDARYYLAGALLVFEKDALAMVATDGHRLAYAHRKAALKGAEPQRVLVPRKALAELLKLVEGEESATFQPVENHLVFSAGGRTLASKTIEGNFPAFEKVIAMKGDKSLSLAREPLMTALRRVSLLSSERSRAVKLLLSTGRLELLASSPDLGEAREALAVEYKGEGLEIGFNAQYMLDFLAAAGGESVGVELKDAESQGLFRPESRDGIDYRYVVMPMRL